VAQQSNIEWTDATWNPITGCSLASPGCTHCYAMKLAAGRLRYLPSREGLTKVVNGHPVWTGEVRFNARALEDPIRWKAPRDIFVCAHGDLFHEDVPEQWIARVFDVMIAAPQHRYQVLTKRSSRMRQLMGGPKRHDWWHRHLWQRSTLCHVILGVSVEDQKRADMRREDLRGLAGLGWTTFCSYEPALGPVDWRGWEFLSWMISGGESGPRPTHPDWHRGTRDWCVAGGVPYLFKQWGSWSVVVDRDRDDPDWRQDYTVSSHNSSNYRILNLAGGFGFHGERVHLMRRVGKKSAGRLLDGREHNDFPEQQEHPR
jgi:protein gp37